MPIEKNKQIYRFSKVSSSSASEIEDDKPQQNGIIEVNGDKSTLMEIDNEDSKFIVIGNEEVGPTCTPM